MHRILVIIGLVGMLSSLAWGTSTLYVGFGANTACATPVMGCPIHPVMNIGPNNNYAASSQFSVYNTSNSANTTLTTPLLLIIGVAGVNNPALFTSNSIIGVSSYAGYQPNSSPTTTYAPGAWSYGSSAFNRPGYNGYFTSNSTPKDAYALLGFGSNVDNSQNLSNWNGTLANIGSGIPAPTGYGIYVFQLNAALGPKGLVNIQFANTTSVPTPSFIFAYGMNGNTPIATPFTKTALQYPEPASWILLSTAGLAAILARKFRGRTRLAANS